MKPHHRLARARNEARQAHPIRDFEYMQRKLGKCQYLYIAETGRYGLGVFAAKPFEEGETVMVDADGDYYDQVFSYQGLNAIRFPVENTLQVGIDRFKLPTGSIDDFTNHSCDPNTGIRLIPSGTIILALRHIAEHEELTYDYSTYLNNPYESMRCHCGVASCRGIVGNFNTLPKDLQERYRKWGIVGDFVLSGSVVHDTSD